MVLNNEESIFESTFNLPCGHMLVDYSFVFMILKNNKKNLDFMNFAFEDGVLLEKNRRVLIVRKKLI
jgi:hypothetical protein